MHPRNLNAQIPHHSNQRSAPDPQPEQRIVYKSRIGQSREVGAVVLRTYVLSWRMKLEKLLCLK